VNNDNNGSARNNSFRRVELYPNKAGRLETGWQLTDTKHLDVVQIAIPPAIALPIVFVPGIMGSNLCNDSGFPVWLLDSVKNIPAGLAFEWIGRGAGMRQRILHPDRTKVYKAGAVPSRRSIFGFGKDEYIRRGWGEVSETSYHQFLLWLENKMNCDRNPLAWSDFSHPTVPSVVSLNDKIVGKLQAGLTMRMHGIPEFAEGGRQTSPIQSDDLLKRSKFFFPIYAFGYNWLRSNGAAAEELMHRIRSIIDENNIGRVSCKQVILVTHSMGGLVARACSQLPDMSRKIAGIVHGVMPTVGAAVAYRRCKIGMGDEDYVAGKVIGFDGKKVTAVFAQAPGALQLLPSAEYGSGWLEIEDPSTGLCTSLPKSDPYEEIYLQRNKWWGLVNEKWLSPAGGEPISWKVFERNIKYAKAFHQKISSHFHHNTLVFYGGGKERKSFTKIRWKVKKGMLSGPNPQRSGLGEIADLEHRHIRTDGSNNLYVGGETIIRTTTRGDTSSATVAEASFWEVRCALFDSAGDGTVPAHSGGFPRTAGGKSILQQFELDGITHEPAYRDFPLAQQVVHYALTKIASLAELK